MYWMIHILENAEPNWEVTVWCPSNLEHIFTNCRSIVLMRVSESESKMANVFAKE